MPEWISVKDRLPKIDTSVIVCTEGGKVFEAMRTKINRKIYWTNAVWGYSHDMCEHTGEITHWQLFPEPPKGE